MKLINSTDYSTHINPESICIHNYQNVVVNYKRGISRNGKNPRRFFLRPIYSKIWENDKRSEFFYLAKVNDYANVMKKYGLGHLSYGQIPDDVRYLDGYVYEHDGGSKKYLTKEEIDHFPKYMRRGGEYGHDPVKISKECTLGSWAKSMCKVYGIDTVIV